MMKKLQAAAILLCMFSYASAATVSIGTVSARGDLRVDSYIVKGNATLFDGSVVETGQASADLRLDKGTQITMSTDSRGTLYRERLILQRGQTELKANTPFQLVANGLRVTPAEPNSRGVVTLGTGNTVEVAALSGSFGVTSQNGVVLASVRPGRAASFAMQAAAAANAFSGTGIVSYENGHYYLTTADNSKYELTGKNLKKYVNTKVQVTGAIGGSNTTGAAATLAVSSIAINGAVGLTGATLLLVTGVAIGTAAGIATGVYEANQTSTPATTP
jgi:hypothetical protein